ncbi:MAG: hypothetical protein K6F98_08930 [Bacteroidales bacterium]|nr:hypothetical protein [Bacteroidales bacterium]
MHRENSLFLANGVQFSFLFSGGFCAWLEDADSQHCRFRRCRNIFASLENWFIFAPAPPWMAVLFADMSSVGKHKNHGT